MIRKTDRHALFGPNGKAKYPDMSRGNNMDKQALTLTEIKRLSAVENVSKILVTDRELETTLQLALDYLIHKSEDADVGIVWIYDPSTDRLIAQGASGFDFNTLKQFRLNTSEEMIGRVFQTGKGEFTRIKTCSLPVLYRACQPHP